MELVKFILGFITKYPNISEVSLDSLIALLMACITATTSILIVIIKNNTRRLNNQRDNQTKLEIADRELVAVKDTNATNLKIAKANNSTAVKMAKNGYHKNDQSPPPLTRVQ
jgi:hypothetical protein